MGRMFALIISFFGVSQLFSADLPQGRIIWWGFDFVRRTSYSEHTNGVVECDDEIVTNVVAIAAGTRDGLAVRSDGTVFGFGLNFNGQASVPIGLSNVISVAIEGNSSWAARRDGTVVRWGGDEDPRNIVAGLRDIKAIAWAGERSYLALRNDGSVLGFRLEESGSESSSESTVAPVRIGGRALSNVVALAGGYTPLVLKNDGSVLCLGFQTPGAPPQEPTVTKVSEDTIIINLGGEFSKTPFHYTTAEPLMIGGRALSTVRAIAGDRERGLALKRDGTVVAWGKDAPTVPAGLSNVTAVAAVDRLALALKRDGTIVTWGDEYQGPQGRLPLPPGLSNVVAIAAGESFGLALTTGKIPGNVYIQPHGRLEEMEREADLIFKGRVISSVARTNVSFPDWGKPHATRFSLISVLKGKVNSNEVVFWHNAAGPGAWGGGREPSWHEFETGQSYLIFAAGLGRPDYLYTPPLDAATRPDEFRQLQWDGVVRTLDARSLGRISMKGAHWLELNRLLTNDVSTNALYAIRQLNRMSKACVGSWDHSDDFKRAAVLKAIAPLIMDKDDSVAVCAIGCFQIGGNTGTFVPDQHGYILRGSGEVRPECVAQVAPYASDLIEIASHSPSSSRRIAAVAAFACTGFSVVTNALPGWLRDGDVQVRAQAVLLLPDFPGEFSERLLRERAADNSPKVRSVVADAIGNGQVRSLLPTLIQLFEDPVGRTNPLPPLTLDQVEEADQLFFENAGDVHTSAGLALLKFDAEAVGDILKTNLDDPGFHVSFLCKLAEGNVEPWLPNLAGVMEARRKRKEQEAAASPNEPKAAVLDNLMYLSGSYFHCWNLIHDYLHELPPEKFAGGKLDRYLNVLENSGNTGGREPVLIYELYRAKGLNDRAVRFRRQWKQSAGYNIGEAFDDVDAKLRAAAKTRKQ